MRRLIGGLSAVIVCAAGFSGCALVRPVDPDASGTASQSGVEATGDQSDPVTATAENPDPATSESAERAKDQEALRAACTAVSGDLAKVFTGLQLALAEASTNPKEALQMAKNQLSILEQAERKTDSPLMRAELGQLRSSLKTLTTGLEKAGKDRAKAAELAPNVVEVQRRLTDLQAACLG